MGIQINGTTDSITAIDGSLSLSGAELATVSGVNVTGVVTATSYIVSAGSTSAPSISPSGDSNTGIFFPSADTIAFGEGGSEVARFDSSGRLGIGTVSPASGVTLHVNASGGGIVRVSRLSASASDYGQLEHDGTNSTLSSTAATIFVTNSSERARIDSSGRLLVGTSTSRTVEDLLGNGPQGLIQIEAANSDAIMSIISAGTADAGRAGTLSLGRHRNSTVGATPTIVQSGDTLGAICFAGGDGTDMRTKGASIACQVDGTPGVDDMPGRLVFSTTADGASSPTERMRISEAGHILGGGMTSLTAGSSVKGFNFENQGNNGRLNLHANSSAGTASGINFYHSGSQVGGITYSSTATAYNTSSDYRLKENVVPLTGAADRLNQLQVHRFNFIADPDKIVDGFLAHEAQAVVPECVTGTKDEVDADGNPVYQGIDQSKLVPLLTAALQEAIAKIETLEAKVAALEAA
jgi:hypothetical protein